jgi:ABC-type transport system involved in cytochrome c biogenesis permease subunit
MKKILSALYLAVIVSMAAATIIEKYKGSEYAATHIYGAWWFTALWALLTAFALAWLWRRHVRRPSAVLLHLSFAVILAGALITHLTSRQGIIHLRKGEPTSKYLYEKGNGLQQETLPFTLTLTDFSIDYHEGTQAPADYMSRFIIEDNGTKRNAMVSMNNICTHRGIRLCQSSFDDDQQGSYLSMNSDPWGIAVTYTGYALLFVSLLWTLADPKGAYRRLLKSARRGKTALAVAALLMVSASMLASDGTHLPPTLPRATAKEFGKLYINYNDRICPVQTFALDFTKKLCGKRSYRGLTAEQVLTGFMFWPEEWDREPVIRLKNNAMRQATQLPAMASVNDFFSTRDGYRLGPMLHEYFRGNNDRLHQEVMKADDRLQLIMQLRQGSLPRLFPVPGTHTVVWCPPSGPFPGQIEEERQTYIQNILAVMKDAAHANNFKNVDEAVAKMKKYQLTFGAQSIPSPVRTRAEHIYNAVPFATILFMVNLSLGFLLLFFLIWKLTRTGHTPLNSRLSSSIVKASLSSPQEGEDPMTAARGILPLGELRGAPLSILSLSWLALTACLALRWTISGTVPMSNGYETMLFVAWLIMLVSLLTCRRFPIILCFGSLMSGFFLLVSHISQMDPQITHLMPVLASPLLTIHVSIIMTAFALLALTFICGLTSLLLHLLGTSRRDAHSSLALLSRLFLYPALVCLAFGIFTGAIWANVSWGTYWSWDPKETWALITFMVYAVALHDSSLPFLRRPLTYHAYMTLAFLTILMTYFGVNYILGGMHSYA